MQKRLDQCIEAHADEMIASLAELVHIRSVCGPAQPGAPYGTESRRAMQYALDLGKKLGFETTVNLEDKVCYIEYGTGSQVVGSFCHLDVVPEGEGWTWPPYSAEIHDGHMYGRGTVDNKGPFIASLYALYAIKECGLPLGDHKIRIVAGTNEETGMSDMECYVKHCGAPKAGFTPDGWFPMSFTERGISFWHLRSPLPRPCTGPVQLLALDGGGKALNVVPDKASATLQAADEATAERVMDAIEAYGRTALCTFAAQRQGLTVHIEVTGLVAHACAPFDGRNAIADLLMLLHSIGFDGSLGDFLDFFAAKIGMHTDGSPMGMRRKDTCGELTFNLSTMHLADGALRWVVNLRYPYTYQEQVAPDFRAQLEPAGVIIEETSFSPSLMYPLDCTLIKTLRRVYEELTGLDSTPGNGGGTYAKKVPNIVAFGNQFPGSTDWCHRSDENIDLAEYVLSAKLYGNALYELTQAED